MSNSKELQELGRAFLAALVTRLGRDGAAAVLLLPAAEMKTAPQPESHGAVSRRR